MVKSASCGTSESCLSISPYSISLAAEVFDCKCNSSKQVHSFAVEKKMHQNKRFNLQKDIKSGQTYSQQDGKDTPFKIQQIKTTC